MKRLLTGILLGALTLGTLWAGGYWWVGFLVVVLRVAASEWARLGGSYERVVALVVLLGFLLVAADLLLFLPLLLFIPLAVLLFCNSPRVAGQFNWLASALLWLSFPAYFLLDLRRGMEISNDFISGIWLVGLLLGATIIQNSMEYYVGLSLGERSTFFNKLSPNKSTAGYLGGLTGVLAVFAFAVFMGVFPYELAIILVLGVGTAGPAGDLLMSAFKREQDLDDTGNILPGHGGILDRIDSLLANTVVFYLILNISRYLG